MNTHHSNNDTPPAEAAEMDRAATSGERRVLEIIKNEPDHAFGYFEIVDRTGFDRDSARRSLSNLSGSHPKKKYLDEYGNWPVRYDSSRRKRNPQTGRTVGTYRWNPIYGKHPPDIRAEKDGQIPMFAPRHRSHYEEV